MSVNGLNVTAVGWAATDPREVVGGGVPFTSFRLATTPRRYDNRRDGWVDGRTEWITVKLFRETAHNVAASVRKGQPLVVHGRLHTEEWNGPDGTRTSLVLEAIALGHDLTRGRGEFVRRTYTNGVADGAEPSGARGDGTTPDHGADPDPWSLDTVLPDGDPSDGGVDETGPVGSGSLDAEEALVTS